MPLDPTESLEPIPVRPTRLHPVWVAVLVTVAATVASYVSPPDYAATVVAGAFLAAVAWLVLRHDSMTIRHFGLSMGGLLEPNPIEAGRVLRDSGRALGWALGVTLAIALPFVIGFRIYWRVRQDFVFRPPSLVDEIFGQLLVIGLPEEAFYRGYLMTALGDGWGTPWTILKAKLGWGWVVSSAVFAVGHFLTEPNIQRLAVFFPALLFGWLRARTGGIGAPALFHVLCNVLASTLTRGYGFAP